MFSLSIAIGNTVWAFRFKTAANAKLIFEALTKGGDAIFEDDYGQRLSVKSANISGFMLEDMSLSREAHIAQMLHNAKIQAEAQHRAQIDPTMRPQNRGPAIVAPFQMPGR